MVTTPTLLLTALPALADPGALNDTVQASASVVEQSSPLIMGLSFAAAVGTFFCSAGAMAFMQQANRFIDTWQQPVKNRLVPIRERYALSKTENWLVWSAGVLGTFAAGCPFLPAGHEEFGLAVLSMTLFLSERQFAKARAYAKDLKVEFDAFMAEDADHIRRLLSGAVVPSRFGAPTTEYSN